MCWLLTSTLTDGICIHCQKSWRYFCYRVSGFLWKQRCTFRMWIISFVNNVERWNRTDEKSTYINLSILIARQGCNLWREEGTPGGFGLLWDSNFPLCLLSSEIFWGRKIRILLQNNQKFLAITKLSLQNHKRPNDLEEKVRKPSSAPGSAWKWGNPYKIMFLHLYIESVR